MGKMHANLSLNDFHSQVATLAKDLANEYHYLGNTSEWFFQARKTAEKVIAKNEQYIKGSLKR